MNAKPILMSAPMVLATLREIQQPGTGKTQTRRIVKPQPDFTDGVIAARFTPDDQQLGRLGEAIRCPYGARGDLLWVRESHYLTDNGDFERAVYAADAEAAKRHLIELDHLPKSFPADVKTEQARLRPSIHMPRWASRLTLRITDVRVERLQDISEEDARAEGVTPLFGGMPSHADEDRPSHYAAFARLWNSINGPGSWDANPWVWAISFRPELRNVDAVLADLQRSAA